MSWPGKLAVALQHFSASLPGTTTTVAASNIICSKSCSCKCKCCSGVMQKYVNFDAQAMASGGPVQKMMRLSTADMLLLLRVAQCRENFWTNQCYKIDMQPDYEALGAVFLAPASVTNVAQLQQIMDTITTGYRRSVASLSGSEAHAALRPKAVAPSYPGLRCGCTDCDLLPWQRLQQLETHQLLHKTSDNWHCCLCYRRYFIQHTLLTHLSRHNKREQTGELLQNVGYKVLLESLHQQEQQAIENVEQLTVTVPQRHHFDYVSEFDVHFAKEPRKVCLLNACAPCNYHYKHSFSHQLHMRQKHKKMHCSRRWQCASCMRSFRTRRFYLQHLRRVRQKCRLRLRRFKCSNCKWRFQLLRSLKPHFAQAHLRYYNCLICATKSVKRCCDAHSEQEQKAAVREHIEKRRQELGRPPRPPRKEPTKITCSICQKECVSTFLLNIHMKKFHLKQADFTCESCGKTFYSKKDISAHIDRVHTMVNAIYCELCDLTIKDRNNYLRHTDSIRHKEALNNVSRTKPQPKTKDTHHCEPCDYKTQSLQNFQKHLKTKKHNQINWQQEKLDDVDEVS